MWDHRPDADALLAARIARGWAPVATDTRDGPVVMGHAACLLGPGAGRGAGS